MWTCVSLTLSLHLPSTRSQVHISPFSDELTRKLLSWMMDARDKQRTGAVCPTSRQRGVILRVSGLTFLQTTQSQSIIVYTQFGQLFPLTINIFDRHSIRWQVFSDPVTGTRWTHSEWARTDPTTPRAPPDSCWPSRFPAQYSIPKHFPIALSLSRLLSRISFAQCWQISKGKIDFYNCQATSPMFIWSI